MNKQSVLWEINHRECKSPSYLLGTIHIQAQFAFDRVELYQKLIRQCDAYAAESHLDELGDQEMPGQFDAAYATQYTEFLSENQYQHLVRFIQHEIPSILGMWMFLHPFLVVSQIEMAIMGQEMPQALDLALWQFAKAEGKELLAIESATMQRDIFEEMELEDGFRAVKRAISNLPSLRKKYTKLAANYKDQDIQSLYRRAKKDLGKAKQPMLYERNVFMAQRIENIILDKSVFIGIGVGHLPGQKGVLRLLKHAGFNLSPVSS